MNPYSTLKTEGKLVLFVNANKQPDQEIPLDHYTYQETQEGDISFYRLYRLKYLQEDQIWHELYDWQEVEVQAHCKIALKQLIDSMTGAREFLKTRS